MMKKYLFILTSLISNLVYSYDINQIYNLSLEQKIAFYKDFSDSISNKNKFSDTDVYEIIEYTIREETEEQIKASINLSMTIEALRFYYTARPDDPLSNFYTDKDNTEILELNLIPSLKRYLINEIKIGLMDNTWIEEKTAPSWWLCYTPLSVYFHEDSEVEELLFDSLASLPSIFTSNFLDFFTFGGHRSQRVQNFRYISLKDDNPLIVRKAVNGIAKPFHLTVIQS